MLPGWWRSNFLAVELGLAIASGGSFALWGAMFDGDQFFKDILSENRGAVYGTLASISGSMLGFVITALAVTLTFSSSGRLALLRQSRHYETMWRVFTASMHALALATIVALLALFLDRDDRQVPALQYAAGGAMVLAVLRIVRTIWVFQQVISLLTGPGRSRTADEP